MATRKARREELRAERRLREETARLAARRKRRLYMLGGVLAAAAAIVGVAVAVSQGGGSSTKHAGGRAGARAVQRQLAGIPQSGITLGRSRAPVTVTEYGDLQCPVCQALALNTLPQLIASDVRAGRVRLAFRNLETATPDPQTFKTEAVAALAAGRQDKLWNYVELFYRNQGREGSGYVTDQFLTSLAKSIPGLDLARWNRDRGDQALVAQVGDDETAAGRFGFQATPSLLIRGPRFPAKSLQGAVSYSQLEQAIKAVER